MDTELQRAQAFFAQGEFTRQQLQTLLGTGEKSARRRIQDWMAEGLLHKIGEGRAATTRYSFAQQVVQDADKDLSHVKTHFGARPFTRKEVEQLLNVKTSTARKRIQSWLDAPDSGLRRSGDVRSPHTSYTFAEE